MTIMIKKTRVLPQLGWLSKTTEGGKGLWALSIDSSEIAIALTFYSQITSSDLVWFGRNHHSLCLLKCDWPRLWNQLTIWALCSVFVKRIAVYHWQKLYYFNKRTPPKIHAIHRVLDPKTTFSLKPSNVGNCSLSIIRCTASTMCILINRFNFLKVYKFRAIPQIKHLQNYDIDGKTK